MTETDTAHWTYTITERHPHHTKFIAMDIQGVEDMQITEPGTKRVHALQVERVELNYVGHPARWTIAARVSGTPRAAAWRHNQRSFWHNPGIGHDMADWPDWLRSLALRHHPDPDIADVEIERLAALR